MSDLASIHDLTLDGTSIQQSPPGIHLEITRGINEIAVFRGKDSSVPHRAGRTPHGHVADIRKLELEGVVLGIGSTIDVQQASYRQLVRGLSALLASASAEPVVLSGILEDGATATINVRVVDFLCDEPASSLAGAPKVALESVDPDWVITGP
jgi:hypothetical protein